MDRNRSWIIRVAGCLCSLFFLVVQGRAQYTPKESLPKGDFLAYVQQENGNSTPLSFQVFSPHNSNAFPGDYRFPEVSEHFTPVSKDFKFGTDAFASPSNLQSFFAKKPKRDTVLFEASPGVDRKLLTFQQRNSGAFKRKKKGGLKDPGMAALCSAVVPGLGQIYNGQWYKTPVLYAGIGVLVYFTDQMVSNRNIYQREIKARTDSTGNYNPDLTSYSLSEVLELRNYYEHNFELCLIIAGAVYLLNIVDAIVYAHLSSFNVSPDLSLSIKPYARTNFHVRNGLPLDAGIRVCLTLK